MKTFTVKKNQLFLYSIEKIQGFSLTLKVIVSKYSTNMKKKKTKITFQQLCFLVEEEGGKRKEGKVGRIRKEKREGRKESRMREGNDSKEEGREGRKEERKE